jgi:hypothetical protein
VADTKLGTDFVQVIVYHEAGLNIIAISRAHFLLEMFVTKVAMNTVKYTAQCVERKRDYSARGLCIANFTNNHLRPLLGKSSLTFQHTDVIELAM